MHVPGYESASSSADDPCIRLNKTSVGLIFQYRDTVVSPNIVSMILRNIRSDSNITLFGLHTRQRSDLCLIVCIVKQYVPV